MKIKEMIGALQLFKKAGEPKQLVTRWGSQIHDDNVLQEYPRPQLVREHYCILNGIYKYAITHNSQVPETWDGDVLVPFSPESYLSGVGRTLMPDEFLWYQREFEIKSIRENHRMIIHFGACDERCRVFINGSKVGFHSGGYQEFSFDITEYIKEGSNTLQVCARDKTDVSYHGRGKQTLKSGGMFYTCQSGLWQTVWYEWVPDVYIENLRITPMYDQDSVKIELKTNIEDNTIPVYIKIYEDGVVISEWNGNKNDNIVITVPEKRSWSPISPFLYTMRIVYGEDTIESYFGMRCFTIENDSNGIPRLCLNHVPYFQNGVLDQGYWPESLLTPPSDAAMINDIKTAKQLGFNMIRKHCKIEPLRWYYHCDRLGMLVWQDMINGGEPYNFLYTSYIPTVIRGLRRVSDSNYAYMSRKDENGRREWRKECKDTVNQLYNCPCICTWVLFNEGWGQFDAKKNTQLVRNIDDTRIIDAHSGWFDQNAGDIRSEHIYFFDLMVERGNKPYVISEYGGLSHHVADHCYSDECFGYEKYDTMPEFEVAYNKMQQRVDALMGEGLCAAVYTQLTDIEEEVNGLMTYDRSVIKVR